MSSQSYQCLFLTIRNNELLTIQDFAHLRSALGPHTHSSHTRRVFLERKLVARSRRSVLSRFFREWKYDVIPPALVDVDTSDYEHEQADSSDDEPTRLESDDDVPNSWDPHHHWDFVEQSDRNYDDVPAEFESDDEPDELESDIAGRLRELPGGLVVLHHEVVLCALWYSRAHGVL